MATIRVDSQAVAEGLAQETQITRAKDDVVGIVHNGNLGAVFQIVLQGIQADLVDQLLQTAAIGAGAPHRYDLFGEVAIEVAQQ